MDLRRLRTFVAVAELGTVSKAALRLRISQPALSRQINELEQEFSFKLFDRVGRRLMLTAVGEQVLDDCRRVLGEVGSLGARLELLRRGGSGVLRVAAPPQTIESVLSRFLPRYNERFPNVQVKLTEALGHEQLTLLERGEVHLGIRHDQGVDPRFQGRALQLDEVLAACAPSLQLGGADIVDIGRLAPYPLLLLDSGYSVRKMFDAACRLAEIEPKIMLESRAPHTLLALAEAGQGVAIIPSILITDRYMLRIVRVAYRRKPLRERLVIQWDKRRPIPSYANSFCELLAEYMSEALPITQALASNTTAARRRVAVRGTRGHKRQAR
jgi:LysR family transcriptional regulator, nitrogen assimilation regulatory protein